MLMPSIGVGIPSAAIVATLPAVQPATRPRSRPLKLQASPASPRHQSLHQRLWPQLPHPSTWPRPQRACSLSTASVCRQGSLRSTAVRASTRASVTPIATLPLRPVGAGTRTAARALATRSLARACRRRRRTRPPAAAVRSTAVPTLTWLAALVSAAPAAENTRIVVPTSPQSASAEEVGFQLEHVYPAQRSAGLAQASGAPLVDFIVHPNLVREDLEWCP